MAQTVSMLKAKIVENAVTAPVGHETWQAKVRKTLTGAIVAALGGFLLYRGVTLLAADKSVGQWLALGGAALVLVGAHIWSGELVNAAITSVAATIGKAIKLVLGGLKKDEPPGPAV